MDLVVGSMNMRKTLPNALAITAIALVGSIGAAKAGPQPTLTPKPNSINLNSSRSNIYKQQSPTPTPTPNAKGLNAVNVKLARTALPTPTPTPKAKTTTVNTSKANTFRAGVHKATPTPKPLKSINLNSSKSN